MSKNFKIGAGIALDGEKQFKQAVSGINQDIKVLASEMGKVTAQFDGNAKSITALTAKQDVLNRQLFNQTEKVDVLKKALQESADKYGESDKRTKEWQISLNKAEAELSKTKNELEKTTKEIDEFGDESKQSGNEIETAGKKAKGSGDDARKGGDGWSSLGQGLAKIGGIAATAVKALAAASIAGATAVGALTVKAGEAADEINTLSKVTGMSTEDIQKFKYASDRIDVSLETLTKSMAKNVKSMKGVQDGTKLSVEAYKKLGVEVLNADGTLRDGQTVYGEVIDALAKMENETERDALAMQILGKSAQELNPLILGGADALKQMGEEAEKAGLILSQSQLDKLNAVSDAVDTLKATMQGVGMQFAAEFAGPISEGINMVTGFVTELLDAYKAGGMDALAEKTGEVLGEVINKFAESLPGILDATTGVINGILDSVIENIPQMTQTGVEFFVSLVSNSSEILSKIVGALPEVVRGIADALTAEDGEMLKKMINAGVDLFVAIITSTAEIVSIIADKLPDIVDGIAESLTEKENLEKMANAGIVLAKAVLSGFKQFFPMYTAGEIMVDQALTTAGFSEEMKENLTDPDKFEKYLKGLKTTGGMIDPALAGYRASGGPVTAGLPYMTGETGPELFVPSTSGYVMSNSQTTGMLESIVNAVNTAVSNMGGDMVIPISLFRDESEFTTVFVQAYRRAASANPVEVSDF